MGTEQDRIWSEIFTNVNTKIAQGFANANRNSNVYKLGRAIALQGLLENRTPSGATLEQADNQAYTVLYPRKQAVEEKRRNYLSHEPTLRAVRTIRENAVRPYHAQAEALAKNLNSPAFQNEMAGQNQRVRMARYEIELARIAAINPELASDTAMALLGNEFDYNALGLVLSPSVPPEAKSTALKNLFVAIVKSSAATDGFYRAINAFADEQAAAAAVLRTIQANNFAAAAAANGHRSTAELIRKIDALPNSPAKRLLKALDTGAAGRAIQGFFVLWSLAIVDYESPGIDDGALVLRFFGGITNLAAVLDDAILFGQKIRGTMSAAPNGLRKVLIGIHGSWVMKAIAGSLGVVSNVLFAFVSLHAAYTEYHNEDIAGVAAKLLGALSFFAGAASGVTAVASSLGFVVLSATIGWALFAVSAVAMILSLAIDWLWGESALTGQIRNDLRALGIIDEEDDLWLDANTNSETVHSGGVLASSEQLGEKIANANHDERQALLNAALDGNTPARTETAVANALIRLPPAEFMDTMQAMGPRYVASELEDPTEGADVMVRAIDLYTNRGQKPGPIFNEQLLGHAYEHRAATIQNFLSQRGTTSYRNVAPGVIVEATRLLMNGHTNGAEQSAITALLLNCARQQFDAVASLGGLSYFIDVRSEVSVSDWMRIQNKGMSGAPSTRRHVQGTSGNPATSAPPQNNQPPYSSNHVHGPQ